RVVVRRLVRTGLPDALRLGVREQMHVREVEPHEEWRSGLVGALDEVRGRGREIVVAGFHALARQRPGVLDLLLAHAAPAGMHGLVVLVCGVAMEHATRAELLVVP